MAERESQSQEGFDWASLPGPALAAVAKALEAKGPLLRTSRLNRDTVLSTSRVVSLTIKHDEKCINVHQPLLRRVCTTARPGIQLELKLKDGGRGGKLWNVGTFLQPFVKKPPLVNVSTLVLKGWRGCQQLGASTSVVGSVFPHLQKLCLIDCHLEDAAIISSWCPQLTELVLVDGYLSRSALSGLGMLKHLKQLTVHDGSGYELPADINNSRGAWPSIAQAVQLTSVSFGAKADILRPALCVAAQMRQLDRFEVVAYERDRVMSTPTFYGTWECLSHTTLTQLLTSCSLLTQLSLEYAIIDQAGLDLLLAHPHITHITLLAIAATQSRVDSPCSWQTLTLPGQVHAGTVAYVPLHSLKQPLAVEAVLLPSDVPSEQLPRLLLAATTRMAQHKELFSMADPSELVVTDKVWDLPSGMHAYFKRDEKVWCMDAETTLELVAAVEPLATGHGITTLSFVFCQSYRNDPACAGFGPPHLAALHKAWGSSLQQLNLTNFSCADGFFPALLNYLPGLKRLHLTELPQETMLEWRLALLCARATRPLTIALPEDYLYGCDDIMKELELYDSRRPVSLVTFTAATHRRIPLWRD